MMMARLAGPPRATLNCSHSFTVERTAKNTPPTMGAQIAFPSNVLIALSGSSGRTKLSGKPNTRAMVRKFRMRPRNHNFVFVDGDMMRSLCCQASRDSC